MTQITSLDYSVLKDHILNTKHNPSGSRLCKHFSLSLLKGRRLKTNMQMITISKPCPFVFWTTLGSAQDCIEGLLLVGLGNFIFK